ncbi:MAG: SoxR reducing system RseC family protein [Gammaproteobacteria bacterium]|nr:SoxR reducing system RseC family protein [Gammaproteobacteria bacterium]
MITETAVVTRCDDGQVEVRLQRASACGGCELSQGCGTGALGRLLGNRSRPLVIPTRKELKPGDELLLGMSEAALVRASLTIYGLPLLAMVLGGLLTSMFGWSDTWVGVSAITGFLVGYKFASYLTCRLEAGRSSPYIVDIRVNPDP